jgi:predicted transcriptional regulator YdeE
METKIALETKVVSPKTYLYHEGRTTLKQLMAYANPVVYDFYEQLKNSDLEPEGPLEFIYLGASDDMEKEFTLLVAMPVKEEKPVGNGYQFKKTDSFKCVSHVYKGDINEIGHAYNSIYQQLAEKKVEPVDEIREVYQHWVNPGSEENITEIQVGIQ